MTWLIYETAFELMIVILLMACEVQLSREIVQNIHLEGGSLLGVSRGGSKTADIVDSIKVSVSTSV